MGLVLGKIWASLFGPSKYKICMIGLDNAGKTSILFRMHLGAVVDTHPTIGSNVETVEHKDAEFQVWDLGGQHAIRQVWSAYFVSSHAVVLVVDGADRARMPLVKTELARVLAMEILSNAVILCFANKQDLPGAAKAREVAAAIGLDEVKSHSWHVQESSVVEGTGISEGLSWLAKALADAK